MRVEISWLIPWPPQNRCTHLGSHLQSPGKVWTALLLSMSACSHPEYSALASSVLPQSLLAPWSDTGGEKCPCLLNISLGVLNSGESTTAIVQRACKTQIDLSCQTHTYVWKNCRSRRSCFQPGLMWRSQASIWVRVARCWTLLSLPEQAMVRARRMARNPLWAVLFNGLYQKGRGN